MRRLDDLVLTLPVVALEADDLHRLDRVAVLGRRLPLDSRQKER
jgi:hypothetical protein